MELFYDLGALAHKPNNCSDFFARVLACAKAIHRFGSHVFFFCKQRDGISSVGNGGKKKKKKAFQDGGSLILGKLSTSRMPSTSGEKLPCSALP